LHPYLLRCNPKHFEPLELQPPKLMIWFMLLKMMLKIRQISYWWDLYSGDFTYFKPKNKKIVTDFSYHNSSSFMSINITFNTTSYSFKKVRTPKNKRKAILEVKLTLQSRIYTFFICVLDLGYYLLVSILLSIMWHWSFHESQRASYFFFLCCLSL
jgi:hypothetical protein